MRSRTEFTIAHDDVDETAEGPLLKSNNKSASLRSADGEVQRTLVSIGGLSNTTFISFRLEGLAKPLNASAASLEALSWVAMSIDT